MDEATVAGRLSETPLMQASLEEHQGAPMPEVANRSPPDGSPLSPFHSVLQSGSMPAPESAAEPAYFRDLNLNQIIKSVTAEWQEYNLAPYFHSPLKDLDAVLYRQEVMRDMQSAEVSHGVAAFSRLMHDSRLYRGFAAKGYYAHEKQRWLFDAAFLYCQAVEQLCNALGAAKTASRGMRGMFEHLSRYVRSDSFRALADKTRSLSSQLGAIRYTVLLREGRITVRRYQDEPDYSTIVEGTFAKFRRGGVKDYRTPVTERMGMNHIQAQIVQGLSRLYPETFRELADFSTQHAEFFDETVIRFDREIQFYRSYLQYVERFTNAGLRFSLPPLSSVSKELDVREAFDAALADKCIQEKRAVITNDFLLREQERIFVVSGPNQGGKTTYARTFGQLHYLAALGCPVPGSAASMFLPDQIFTHFEQEEDIQTLRGKLQDDLIRIRDILERATSRSLVIMNELFQSTTLHDAIYLSKAIMERLARFDLLGAWVTFLTELSTFNEKTVSVVSAIRPDDPAVRTFKLERRPAEGLAYALAVAQKYRLTYDAISERIKEPPS